MPGDVQSLLLALGNRTDLAVEVARYGKGKFSLSVTR
jgi:hypothetical protein